MPDRVREEFSGKAPPELLEQMRKIDELEGRDFGSALEDAMRAYADSKRDELLHREAMKQLKNRQDVILGSGCNRTG